MPQNVGKAREEYTANALGAQMCDADTADEGQIQRADVDSTGRVCLTLYRDKTRRFLVLDPATRRLSWPAQRPDKDGAPPARQKILREHLQPGRLRAIRDEEGITVLDVERPGGARRELVFEAHAPRARVVLCTLKGDKRKVVEVFGDRRPDDGRDLKKGRVYTRPAPAAPAVAAPDAPPDDIAAAPAATRRDPLAAALATEVRRIARLIKNRRRDAAKHEGPERLYRRGELLKAHLHDVSRGMDGLDVPGPDGPVHIPLDPALSPADNLERTFHRAKRARRAQSEIAARLDEAEALQRQAAELTVALQEHSEDPGVRDEAAQFLRQRTRASRRKRAQAPGPRKPYRAFFPDDKDPVYVGRSARDNDTLTFRVARGNDTWMHARGVAGSHVIIPAPLESVGTERLLDAAHLAVHFSKLRGQSRADVSYTAKKHVRKPGKGAPAGLVLVEQERVLHLVVDEDRLKKLLATER